jgi:hypothetical protein
MLIKVGKINGILKMLIRIMLRNVGQAFSPDVTSGCISKATYDANGAKALPCITCKT